MKKYFAKWLPVEGEIEVGDWYIDDASQVRKSITNDKDYWASRESYQKVKLFLCSRDIQVGDIVKHYKTEYQDIDYKIEAEVSSKEISLALDEALRDGFFKVIGEISPEATWVKEGDEFDEDELDPYLYCLKHPDESFYFDEFNQILEWIKLNPNPIKYKVVVKILGPCKHFH